MAKRKRQQYGLDLLLLGSNNDYGALRLEDEFGLEDLRQKCKASSKSKFRGPKKVKKTTESKKAATNSDSEPDNSDDDLSDCYASVQTFAFTSKADRDQALALAYAILNSDAVDEDHSKHHAAHVLVVPEEEEEEEKELKPTKAAKAAKAEPSQT